jgi:hypothetical protein
MKPVEINGRKDVGNLGFDDIGLGKQLDFAASDARVHLQLTRSGDEILLQHLHDTNARSGAGGSAHNSRARRCFAGAALSSAYTRTSVSKKLRALMKLVAVEAPALRVALPGKTAKFFNSPLGIVSARQFLQVVARLLPRAGVRFRARITTCSWTDGKVHTHSICLHVCVKGGVHAPAVSLSARSPTQSSKLLAPPCILFVTTCFHTHFTTRASL